MNQFKHSHAETDQKLGNKVHLLRSLFISIFFFLDLSPSLCCSLLTLSLPGYSTALTPLRFSLSVDLASVFFSSFSLRLSGFVGEVVNSKFSIAKFFLSAVPSCISVLEDKIKTVFFGEGPPQRRRLHDSTVEFVRAQVASRQ